MYSGPDGRWSRRSNLALLGSVTCSQTKVNPLLTLLFSRSLQRPVHHVVPPSTVTEDYLRSFRPYHTAEDLRMSSLPPLGLDPATAAAYYHPSYLAPHPFPHPAFR